MVKALLKKIFAITTTRFKTGLLTVILLYLPIIFSFALRFFNTTDITPDLKPINTEFIKKLGPFAVRINVGMYIKNFPVFDLNKNTFVVDAVLWFEFNGDEIMLETIDKFSIDNGKIISKSPPDIRITGDRVLAKYNVLFELKTDLQFQKFPFEDHRFPIVLSNDAVTPNEMYFMVDVTSFQLSPTLAPFGWKVRDLNVDAGYLPMMLDRQDKTKKTENPKALFIINFAKSSVRKTLVIFVPLYSAVLLSLLAFIMNVANTTGKISLAITAVTALLGYRFVIEQMLPQVSYFTTTDIIYLFLLIFSFLCFLAHLLLTRQYLTLTKQDSSAATDHIERTNSIIFIAMSLLLIAVTTYIILS